MNQSDRIVELLSKAELLTGEKIEALNYIGGEQSNIVTIIGQPQDRLLNLILNDSDENDKINMSYIHGYRCTVKYGKEKMYSLINDEQIIETTEDTIVELLSTFDSTAKPVEFMLQLPNAKLENIKIEIVASDADFEDIDIDKIAIQSDYCFMTLSATALLSMSQRKILRKGLIPKMGNNLGVFVLDFDLVPESGKQDLENAIESFFKGLIPVYYVAMNQSDFYSTLLLLNSKWDELHADKASRANKICLEQALEKVKKTIDTISSDEELIEDALALLNEKAKVLPSRQEAASRRCRMKFISTMQVECSGELSNFYQAISDGIHEDIQKSDDIEKMQEVLPQYIAEQWKRGTEQLSSEIEREVGNMEKELISYIEKDIVDFLGNGGNIEIADYLVRITNCYSGIVDVWKANNINSSLVVNAVKDRTSLKKGGAIAAGIGLVFTGHPLIGAGIAIYGLTKAGKNESLKILEKNKQSLISAVDRLCAEYYDTAVTWLDDCFNNINNNVNNVVKESYNRIMDGMVAVIQARKSDAEAKENVLRDLHELEALLSATL